jgi:Flp pilus assembly protein TadG
VARRWTGSEEGSSLPFVLVCWLVAALMCFGAVAASDAFLEQQRVQSACDGAALAAVNQTENGAAYARGVSGYLPLDQASAQVAVADQLADGGTRLDGWSVRVTGVEATVTCTRSVQIAFGWLFLGGAPLERTAVASARAPTA